MKTLILLTFLLAGIQYAVLPQYTISGKVSDKKTNKALSRANIILENTSLATISDPEGKYKIKVSEKGKYKIKVSYLGYKTIFKNIEVNESIEVDFSMEPTYILEDEVIIKAVRVNEKVPITYSNVDKKDIKTVNLGQDLPYLIENTPSVVVTSDAGAGVGYTNIRIRGTDISRINVTINGIPLNDPESNGVFWVDIPDLASSIEMMQIQRGVGTSTNGASAFGASINILTQKVNPEKYAELNASYGSFNTYKTNLRFGTGLINNKWAFDGRVSKLASDGYIDRAWSDLKSFFLSGSYYGKNSLIKINLFSGKEQTYQAWGGVPKDKLESDRTYNPYTYENEIDDYQQDHYHLIYSKEINKKLELNTSLFYIKGKGYYEQYREKDNLSDYRLQPIQLFDTIIVIGHDTAIYADSVIKKTDLVRQKWLDNDFYGITYSLIYDHENLKAIIGGAWNNYEGNHFGEVIWAKYMSNGKKDHEWYRNLGKKRDFNIFAKVQYQLTEQVNLYADLQYRSIIYSIDGIHDDLKDLTQKHTFDFINPKLGVFYDLNSNQNIYFAWALANREPSRNNYRDADHSKTPKSEKLFDYELGYKYNSEIFSLNANLYYMNYKDQLVLTGEINNVGNPIMTNADRSYRTGIEIASEIKIWSKLKWHANLTISQNKIKDFVEYVDRFDENWNFLGQKKNDIGETDLSFSPNFIGNSIFKYRIFKNLDISLITKYIGDQYIDNTSNNERKLDAYLLNDIRIAYNFKTQFTREIGFYLTVNNLFNEKYESNAWVYRYYLGNEHYNMFGFYPQAGINFLAGISVRF